MNLKPCPFCGGEARIKTKETFDAGTVYRVECNSRDCFIAPNTTYHWDEKFVRKMWNTRGAEE